MKILLCIGLLLSLTSPSKAALVFEFNGEIAPGASRSIEIFPAFSPPPALEAYRVLARSSKNSNISLYQFWMFNQDYYDGDNFVGYSDGDPYKTRTDFGVKFSKFISGSSYNVEFSGSGDPKSVSECRIQEFCLINEYWTYLHAVQIVNIQNSPISYNIRVFSGAIPEPGTWISMIIGFSLVGATLRRRKIQLPD